jgi:hypothetical protein
VFDGFDDIYVKAALLDNFDKKNYWRPMGMNWFSLRFIDVCYLSFTQTISYCNFENNSENIFEQHYGFSHCIYYF